LTRGDAVGRMRELDCDFCGAPAEGAYEVGPPSVDRAPPERRRLVLCPDCHETLDRALEPLLDRLDDLESGDTSGGTADVRGTDARPESIETDVEPEPNAGVDSEPADDVSTGPNDDPFTEASVDDGTGPDAGSAPPSAEDAEAVGSSASDSDDPPRDGRAATDDSPDAADELATHAGTDGNTESSDGAQSEVPTHFRRVIRLLNNREFPVDHDEFVDLATGAYELAEPDVERILKYAAERDLLVVENGRIDRA
jgi:hypothetical protein